VFHGVTVAWSYMNYGQEHVLSAAATGPVTALIGVKETDILSSIFED